MQSPLRRGFGVLCLALTLGAFAISPAPNAFGVTPPPDGGYLNQTTAEGDEALSSLTTGIDNTALGYRALFDNTEGSFNTATGAFALRLTTGDGNTAHGHSALRSNTLGVGNTATGDSALFGNTTGDSNTANGRYALVANTTGTFNTANGGIALYFNTTGSSNTATGYGALFNNNTGSNNTATGSGALPSNTTGTNNIALGVDAGLNLTTGDNNIVIGHFGAPGDSNKIRLGRQGTQTDTRIAGIRGSVIPNGTRVVVNASGRLGTAASSARFKQAIKPMEKASEALLRLEPVTFRYKEEIDSEGIPQFGLIAEQVEKIDPALVERDEEGKVFSVRYEAVNAMLLNEFLKEHRRSEDQARKVQELEATVAQQRQEQQKAIEALTAKVDAQAAGTQKVAARNPRSRSGRH